MRKFMKYEIRGSYRFILGIIAILLIASTIIQYNIYKASYNVSTSYEATGIRAFTLFISILAIFGAFLSTFLYIVGLFRKELYESRGYLTFTLPLTGHKILGAKILVGVIWYAIITLSIVLYNLFLATVFHGSTWIQAIKRLISFLGPGTTTSIIISSLIISLQSTFLSLVLVYLSIVLSKVSIKNKKIGGLWFVIFLVLSGLTSYLIIKISQIFPYYLDISNLKILHYYDVFPLTSITGDIGRIFIYGSNLDGYINIFGSLLELLFIVLGFLATGYLIEKKIDL